MNQETIFGLFGIIFGSYITWFEFCNFISRFDAVAVFRFRLNFEQTFL